MRAATPARRLAMAIVVALSSLTWGCSGGGDAGAPTPGAETAQASPDAPAGRSAFVWAWGQFLDHDLDLTMGGDEPFPIPVPAGWPPRCSSPRTPG